MSGQCDVVLAGGAARGFAHLGVYKAMEELALERSGPERFLSCMVLFSELVATAGADAGAEVRKGVGKLLGDLICLRNMSLSVANSLDQGEDASLKAVVVKDLGAEFELFMGEEMEKHVITKSTIIYIPENTVHCPFNINMVTRSFLFMQAHYGPKLTETSRRDLVPEDMRNKYIFIDMDGSSEK